MEIHTNIPPKNFVKFMRLGGNARFMTDVRSIDEIIAIIDRAAAQNLPFYILGGGSNTIVHDEGFDGIVIRNRIMGQEILSETPSEVSIRSVRANNGTSLSQKPSTCA